ncbi:MAG TPA: 30S ribosomal protein S1 [Acidimicrobiia bacterium]|nr:30S ribosomal protein S1 [Acidimicrobiia bacterium]
MGASGPPSGEFHVRGDPIPMTDETTNAPAGDAADADEASADTAVAVEAPEGEASTETQAPTADAAIKVDDGIEVADPAAALQTLGDVADDLSAEDFAAAVEKTVVELKEGTLVTGTIVRVDPDEVLVDIGYKSEGVIPAKELSIRNTVNPNEIAKVGDQVEALVMQMEDQDGRLILSKKRAQYERAWGRIEKVMEEGGTVTGQVIEVVKGGLIVDIGLRGFLPASLVELRRVRDLHPYVGETLEAKVIELDKNRNNVVLSRRAYLEEEQAEQRQAFLDELASGEVREGVVSSVVNFGAFVDLGGMDGLVHVSELSWQHVSHPSEVVSVGDKVKIKVLEVDLERERISLSIRQTREDPWESFSDAHGVGDVIDGTVTKTVPFGAFVSVADGVEGLVHVSEIAIHHVESPELELSVDQAVRVKVTEIDEDRRRISLSIKQALPEWENRSQWQDDQRDPGPSGGKRKKTQEFEREEEAGQPEPVFNADSSLEAILEELKQRGIGRK